MSQYFTYNDLNGRLPIDALTSQPECKTCSKTSCYNTYDNVQGVSRSKHEYTASFALNDLKPMEGNVCDVSMIGCVPASIQNSDPYNITVKSNTKCDPLNMSYRNIHLPVVDGSLDRNKRESSRYTSSRSYDNYSRTAANVVAVNGPYTNYTLNVDQKFPLTADGLYKKKSESVRGKLLSSKTSSISPSVKLSVPSVKLSTSPVAKISTSSVKSTTSSIAKPNKIPVVVPVAQKKKLVDNYDFESFINQLNL